MRLMELYRGVRKDLFRYVKFVFGGGLSLILNLIITYFLTEMLALWHMLSFGIALCVEILFLFGYHSLVTFRKKGKFGRFVIVILFISVLNWGFVYLLSVTFGLQYLISIVVSAGVISIVNYLINRAVVFKDTV
jgi:putative flippase GtrA